MSMTREEAIIEIKNMLAFLQEEDGENLPEFLEAVDLATRALHPVSREQVKKVYSDCSECSDCKLCIWNETKRCNDCHSMSLFKPFSNFCPKCGKPLTDEAVQITMKRLEALKDE